MESAVPARTKGPLMPCLSDRKPKVIVSITANTYGGTERSWARAAEKPNPVMIVGTKNEDPYEGTTTLKQ